MANRTGAAHRRPPPTTAANSRQTNRQTLYEQEIYCKTQHERADRDSSKSDICSKSHRSSAQPPAPDNSRQQPPTADNPTARPFPSRRSTAKHNVREPTETAQRATFAANRKGAAHRRPRPTTASKSRQHNRQTLHEQEMHCKALYERA